MFNKDLITFFLDEQWNLTRFTNVFKVCPNTRYGTRNFMADLDRFKEYSLSLKTTWLFSRKISDNFLYVSQMPLKEAPIKNYGPIPI